jgi:hypothetical protein
MPCLLPQVRFDQMYRRTFRLSLDTTALFWVSKHLKPRDSCIRIADIKEVRTGRHTHDWEHFVSGASAKQLAALGSEANSFSIIFGEHYETVNLSAPNSKICNAYILGLQVATTRERDGGWGAFDRS